MFKFLFIGNVDTTTNMTLLYASNVEHIGNASNIGNVDTTINVNLFLNASSNQTLSYTWDSNFLDI